MTNAADVISFGGETSSLKLIRNGRPIETIFPKMGSGISPTAGGDLSKVASHGDIHWNPVQQGGAQAPLYQWTAEKDYGIALVKHKGKTTIYYGGPGGRY